MRLKYKAMLIVTHAIVISWCIGTISSVVADDDGVAGIISVSSEGEYGYIAALIPHNPEMSILGIQWYNNDNNNAFERILIGPANESGDILSELVCVGQNVAGDDSGWCEYHFSYQCSYETEYIVVVFVVPADCPYQHLGEEGGLGIGYYGEGVGMPFMISHDGEEWIQGTGGGLAARIVPGTQSHSNGSMAGGSASSSSINASIGSIYRFGLEAPRPNPANPKVNIVFTIPSESNVILSIYDIQGRRVRVLVTDRYNPGRHMVSWDGLSDGGGAVASGVYFAQLHAGRFSAVKRITVVR